MFRSPSAINLRLSDVDCFANINEVIKSAAVKYLTTPDIVPGQQLITSSGPFIVPAGVTTVSAVAVGPCAPGETDTSTYWLGGGGGGLAYINDLPVTPGETLTVTIGGTPGARLNRVGTVLLRATGGASNFGGAAVVGTGFTGGNGDQRAINTNLAGAGAAGYTANGGSATTGLLGGGGTSVLGGSVGGTAGGAVGIAGGTYGGGGAIVAGVPGAGGPGAIRIIWGAGRSFPNTNTGDL